MKKDGFLGTVRRRSPSPAMVVACIALVVALGGTSYAAIRLPPNSVGTPQLKRSAVTAAKVRGNSLTGTQINEESLARQPGSPARTESNWTWTARAVRSGTSWTTGTLGATRSSIVCFVGSWAPHGEIARV